MPHHEGRERRAEIDEGGSECEDGREHEADRIRDLEPRIIVFEEDPRCPDRVQAEEAARGQEGKRDQEHTRVAATVCRLAGSVGEHENADAHCQEETEMDGVVRPIEIELVTQQERDEADKRQRCRQDPHRACQRAAAAARPWPESRLTGDRWRSTVVTAGNVDEPPRKHGAGCTSGRCGQPQPRDPFPARVRPAPRCRWASRRRFEPELGEERYQSASLDERLHSLVVRLFTDPLG